MITVTSCVFEQKNVKKMRAAWD